jgi:hypothetical protein
MTIDEAVRDTYRNEMAKQSVKKIIEERGGYVAVAAALSTRQHKVAKTTVHTWWRKNAVPGWWMDAVISLPKQPKQGASA